jgi:N4-gp56 family major capsid protein
MALQGGAHQGSNFGKANLDTFIPEIWSQEVKRQLDNNLIMREQMRINPVQFARKGDTVHIPEVYRLAVNDKVYNTPVTLQNQTSGEFTMTVDKYKEVSFMIEDVAELFIPGNSRIRSEYTREAGYALARDIDNFLLGLRATIQNEGTQHIYSTNNGAAGGTFEAIDEAAILAALQLLDEANVPREGRCLVVSPGQHTDLLTIDRFSSADYVNNKPVTNGVIGSIYGVPVKTSTQIGINSLTGYTNGKSGVAQPTPGVTGSPYIPTQSSFTSLPYNGDGTHTAAGGIVTAMLCHPDWAYATVVQEPKVESSREVLYQADAIVTTQLYGAKVFRPDHAVLIHSLA